MNPPATLDIQALHFAYRKYSGMDVKLDFWRESQWREWFRYGLARGGWTENDLKAVIELRQYRAKKKLQGRHSVSFNDIIGSPDLFEECLCEARAHQRKPAKEQNKESVLHSTGRNEETRTAPLTPAQIMEQSAKLASLLKQYREQL